MKHLSFTTDSVKEDVEDVKDVNEEMLGGEEEEESGHTVTGEIVSVISTSEYRSCKYCRCKVVVDDDDMAECSKCHAVMKMSRCEEMKAAKFVVEDESRGL